MYIILAILAFGILILVHELGHFVAAKSFDVKVLEFSIGMGPRILKKQGKETLYSLRVLPIGGSCLMEGEDSDTGDSRSFTAQKRWKRVIILLAGAFCNFVIGILLVVILVIPAKSFGTATITDFADGFPLSGEDGLMIGDKIVEIDNERVYYIDDFSVFMQLADGAPVDMVVVRDGGRVMLNNLPLSAREYTIDGEKVLRYGITFENIEATGGEKAKYGAYTTYNFVRLIRISLGQLITGEAGIGDLASPIGIVDAINDVGQDTSIPTAFKIYSITNFFAFIAVNLGIFNLLPIPALDGGRIFFLVITAIVEKIARRRVDPKYEGYIHTAGFLLLIGLMLFVMANDVVKIISG